MKLEITKEWLLQGAKKDDDGVIGVGGLGHRLQESTTVVPLPTAEKSAVSTLVELQRRKLRYSVSRLAEEADVDVADIVSIEHRGICGDPRTMHKIAHVLKLPVPSLIRLSGLAEDRDPRLEAAAIRFAAKSAPMERLTREETEALEEFVRILAES